MIKVSHLELVRRCSADDGSSKREVSVAWKYTHTVWHGSDNVDVTITGYLRQSQPVRHSTGKIDIGHSNEILVSVIPENKDASLDSRTGFLLSQHNVEVAVAVEIGGIDGALTAGENICHNRWRECSVALVQRRPKMK